ncbi:MAG: hypothetical protein ACYC7A_17540 [Thermoanaerobaculia bacterium]
MRTLIVLLSLLTVLPGPASAQCVFGSALGESYRLSALDVAIDQGSLWVATSWGISLYDRTSGGPEPVVALALPGTTSRVRPAGGGLAYVASGSSVYAVRATGNELRAVGSADAGALINDLLYDSPYLYAATSKGVVQFELFAPERPIAARTLSTTSGLALSLARFETSLLIADGDSTVDVYTLVVPSIPQKAGVATSLPRSSSVRTAGGFIFVSDGFQTDVMVQGPQMLQRVALVQGVGALAFSAIAPTIAWTAGNDRVLRAVDFTDPAHVAVLYEELIPSGGGSANRVYALANAEGQLYVAAGDAGLFAYDTSEFRDPFPLRSHAFGGMRGIASFPSAIVAARETGGMARTTAPGSNGELTYRDEIATSVVWTILDASADRMIAAGADAGLVLWNPLATPPAEVSSWKSPRAAVRSAVLQDNRALAVLADRSVWRVDFSQPAATATNVTPPGTAADFVSAAGSAIVLGEVTEAGTTVLRYWATGDLSAAPVVATLDGAATAGVALGSDGVAAAVTYRGLNIVEFGAGGTVRIIPRTSGVPAIDLQFSGGELLVLTPRGLDVRSGSGFALAQSFAVPGTPAALHAQSDIAYVATSLGVTSILRRADRALPESLDSAAFTNEYYRDGTAAANAVFLSDGRNVDRYVVSNGVPRRGQRVVSGANVADLVATGSRLVTLSSTGLLTAVPLAAGSPVTHQIDEGADAAFLEMHAFGDAVYVTLSRGCLSGGCEKKTLVFDARQGLTQTATLAGGLLDFAVTGTTAWGLFDLPAEIRILNLADPFHPVAGTTIASEGNPLSIAHSSTRKTVYTIGARVYAYADQTLAKTGELLAAWESDPSARVGYDDQQLRIDGDCALVTGRTYAPLLFRITGPLTWESAAAPSVPAPAKVQFSGGGTRFILTDYSLELWRATAVPLRKRPVR